MRWKVVVTREDVNEEQEVVWDLHSTQCITEHDVKKLQLFGQPLQDAIRSAAVKAYFEVRDFSAEAIK